MSILSQVAGGRITFLAAVAHIIPYIENVLHPGGAATPEPPAAPNGAADQIETIETAIKAHVHAYVIAKLGDGTIASLIADRVTALALTALAGLIEGALRGAALAGK